MPICKVSELMSAAFQQRQVNKLTDLFSVMFLLNCKTNCFLMLGSIDLSWRSPRPFRRFFSIRATFAANLDLPWVGVRWAWKEPTAMLIFNIKWRLAGGRGAAEKSRPPWDISQRIISYRKETIKWDFYERLFYLGKRIFPLLES